MAETYGAAAQAADKEIMDMKWNYKIELADESVFVELEKERGIEIPEELKKIIIEGNAATPEKYKFTAGSTEHVLGAVLSFNKGEEDTDTVFTALDVIESKDLMPFAIDPFGNYICMDIKNNEIVFWDHETDDVYGTGKNITKFFDSLY